MTIHIITGDCRDMLATLPDASVQCVVTSPPYFGLRDYEVVGQIGLEETPDAYVARLVEVFREVRRVLRNDGTFWLNLGDCFQNKQLLMVPVRVALALQADGWWLRSDIIWHKANPMPESITDRPTSAHEHVFLLTKRSAYYYDAAAIKDECVSTQPAGNKVSATKGRMGGGGGWDKNPNPAKSIPEDGRNARNVWRIASQPYSGAHFATMPPELVERCIKAGTSERGQCPHCGSPWVRQVERKDETREPVSNPKARGLTDTAQRQDGRSATCVNTGHGYAFVSSRATTGQWAASCECPEHQPVQQVVLDCFGGAGTTALVADRLGRDATLIELNPEYVQLARKRIEGDAPMFAKVVS